MKAKTDKIKLEHIVCILYVIKGITKANIIYKQSGSVKQINTSIFYKAIHALLTQKQLNKKEIKTYLIARKDFEWFKISSKMFTSKKYNIPQSTEHLILGLPDINTLLKVEREKQSEQFYNLFYDYYYNNVALKYILKNCGL